MCLGIPARVVEISDPGRMTGTVEVSGVRRAVNLVCVAEPDGLEALLGDWVLVHAGFAMSRIDPEEAAATLAALDALGEAAAEVEAMRASAAAEETPP